MTKEQVIALQKQLNAQGAGLKVDGILGPKTLNAQTQYHDISTPPTSQKQLDSMYNTAVTSHPEVAGNSADALSYAASSGDFSNLLDSSGKPFSTATQAAAVDTANQAISPYYQAEQAYDTSTTANKLANDKQDYQDFLNTQATNFQTDKGNLDQSAANQGVLFSGGRLQQQQKLEDAYKQAQASKLASVGGNISDTAGAYQYKYGNTAATNPSLSQYYNLGGNAYNAGVARNGVTATPNLSTAYNTGNYNYQGTEVNAQKAATQQRAAGLLANQGNKLVAGGYKNQF